MEKNSTGTETMEFMGKEYRLESNHLKYKEAERQRMELGANAVIDNIQCQNGQFPDCWRLWKQKGE